MRVAHQSTNIQRVTEQGIHPYRNINFVDASLNT